MKKLFILIFIFFITSHAIAQSGIFFQAIARDRNANPAKDRKLYVQTNIIQSTTTGIIVLTEEHQTFTDAFGIFSILVGSGARVGGTVTGLSTIVWSKGPYYLNIKIVITPIAASNTWDYTKEWVDIGTTIFGAVPFALYSANTAKIDDKLNTSDTTKMLEPYAKGKTVQVLSTTIDTKLATKDTAAMLAPYAKMTYNLDSNYLKKQIASLLGASDTIKYTKQTYTDSALLTKMNIFDKSIYAKKAYVDSVNYIQRKFVETSLQSKFNLADTIKYTKKSFTDSALLTKLNITGNAFTATFATTAANAGTASTATKLAIARKINNVAFDGSVDITITADAGTLTGATLNSTVTNSNLTSVGTLTNTTINGKLVVGASSATSSSAVLEANSTTQGFLPPRMTTTQRDAILSPTTGLIIFNTTTNGLEVRNSNGWVLLTPAAVALPTVVIGTQQWMEKNLDVLTYRNGDVIPQVTDTKAWAALTTGAWCYFNDDPSGYGSIYGKLYNWYAVNDPRGLAPQGWHIPTDEEWTSLRTKLGGELAGAKMKTTTRWINPTNAYKGAGTTNESGFSGLPGICREESGKFFTYIGQVGYWWTASDYSTSNAYYRLLSYDTDNFLKGNENKKRGFSVRCIRD